VYNATFWAEVSDLAANALAEKSGQHQLTLLYSMPPTNLVAIDWRKKTARRPAGGSNGWQLRVRNYTKEARLTPDGYRLSLLSQSPWCSNRNEPEYGVSFLPLSRSGGFMGPGTITGTKGFSCLVAGMAAVLAAATPAGAQQNRIPAGIDASQSVALTNHVHPKAQRQYDRGPVDAGFVMDRLSVMLAPSAEQQAKLDAYLSALQDPGSPDYRNWLTPEQFADRFGVSTSDLGQITGWLGAQGFTIRTVAPSRNWVAFSGTASQVRQTFRTETHRFQVNGELHFSNTADPSVPAALHGVITAIRGLNDFAFRPPQPHLTPAYTAASGNHYLAPADLATIYNLNSLAANGYDGTGQKLAIVGQSAVDLTTFATSAPSSGCRPATRKLCWCPEAPTPEL